MKDIIRVGDRAETVSCSCLLYVKCLMVLINDSGSSVVW
jgi:hypothetical protein